MRRELIVTLDSQTSDGQERTVLIDPIAPDRWQITLDDRVCEVDARQVRPGTWSLIIAGRSHLVDLDHQKRATRVVSGLYEALMNVEDARQKRLAVAVAKPADSSAGEVIRAPTAGKVVTVIIAMSQSVAIGDRTVVLEAMKMENEIKSERGGVVDAIHVEAGQSVEAGDALVTLVAAVTDTAADTDAPAESA